MKQNTKFELYDGVEVPVSPLLKRQRSSRYGSIADLDDEDLIDPAEVERIYLKTEFAPILALPVKTRSGWIRRDIDEDGTIEVGAFGTVDFDRYVQFDKALYKADKLVEEAQSRLILFQIISERIQGMDKYRVLKCVGMGIIELEDITNDDMHALAKLYLQLRKTKKQVAELREASKKKRMKKVQAWLDS